MTNVYRYRVVVADDRSITIDSLPVERGVEVEVLILVDVAVE
jgi:hypothetical protein